MTFQEHLFLALHLLLFLDVYKQDLGHLQNTLFILCQEYSAQTGQSDKLMQQSLGDEVLNR